LVAQADTLSARRESASFVERQPCRAQRDASGRLWKERLAPLSMYSKTAPDPKRSSKYLRA
jgi:hypothetical protein